MTHGSLLGAYDQMNRPSYPTRSQIETLQQAAALPAAEQMPISGNQFTIDLPAQSLAVVEIR
jgi:hypothetical protein